MVAPEYQTPTKCPANAHQLPGILFVDRGLKWGHTRAHNKRMGTGLAGRGACTHSFTPLRFLATDIDT
jgi:hypothetical protein